MIILIVFDFHVVGFSLISIWSMEMMIGLTALDQDVGFWYDFNTNVFFIFEPNIFLVPFLQVFEKEHKLENNRIY